MGAALAEILGPFRTSGRPNWPVIALFVLVNGLVAANALLHDPRQGYDAADRLNYIRTLGMRHVIPSCKDTGQCYVPPLPYFLPAIILASRRITLLQAGEIAQLANVVLSLGLTYYLLKICDLLKPGGTTFKFASLAMLGVIPLYYKTFALIRGEAYLAFLSVFAFYLLLSIFVAKRMTAANVVMLGLTAGLSVLAVQWGFVLLPAILIFAAYAAWRDRSEFRAAISVGAASLLAPLLVAGWYYATMYTHYGTFLAAGWDRNQVLSAKSALPLSFFTGLGSGQIFAEPVRPNYPNELLPIFYSDVWGDYGAYFLIYGRDMPSGEYVSGQYLAAVVHAGPPFPSGFETNWQPLADYLGRVNLLGLIPSAVLVAASIVALLQVLQTARRGERGDLHLELVFALLVVGLSLAGYLWYLVHYQAKDQSGDLIKAVHMIQVFPFLALLAGSALERLQAWRPAAWSAVMFAVGLVFAYSLPAMITRYTLMR